MVRWSYLLPRVVVVVLLLFAAEYAVGPFVRHTLSWMSRRSKVATVEIDRMQLGLLSGTLDGRGVAVEWPGEEGSWSVWAERIAGRIDRRALAHGQWHFDRLKLSGLQVGRQAEPVEQQAELGWSVPHADWLREEGRQRLAAWAGDVRSRLSERVYRELETVQAAAEIRQRWQSEFATQNHRLRQWQELFRELQQRWTDAETPASRLELAAELALRSREVRAEIDTAVKEVDRLQEQWERDRERLDSARRRDQRRLSQSVRLDAIDSQALTETLVGDRILSLVQQSLETSRWLQWGVQMVARKPKWNRMAGRGVDYEFTAKSGPDVWIRRLDFDAVWKAKSGPRRFVGWATDLTDDREKLNRPTRLRWRVESGTPLEGEWVHAVPGNPVEQLWRVRMSRWEVADRNWGEGDWHLKLDGVRGVFWLEARQMSDRLVGKGLAQLESGRAELVWSLDGESRPIIVPLDISDKQPVRVSVRWQEAEEDRKVEIRGDLGDRLVRELRSVAAERIEQRLRQFADQLGDEQAGLTRLVEWQLKEQRRELTNLAAQAGKWMNRLGAWVPYGGMLRR